MQLVFSLPCSRCQVVGRHCYNMLFFRSEERVREWCVAHGYPMRPLVTMEPAMDACDDLVFDALTGELAASAAR